MKKLPYFLLTALFIGSASITRGEADPAPVKAWLEAQKAIPSAQSAFLQERFLSRVTKPLKSSGVFYFKKPRQFRWEIGHPARTVIVADAQENLTILDIKKNEAAVYTWKDVQEGRAPAAAGFLAGGMPDGWEALDKIFRIQEVKIDETGKLSAVTFSLQDHKASAFVLRVQFEIQPETALLQRVILQMRDGGRYVTTFSHQQTDVVLPENLFHADTTGFTAKKK